MPGQLSLPCIPHRLLVVPQAVAALEREHRAELDRLSSSLEAKHREVRGSQPWPVRRGPPSWCLSLSLKAPSLLPGKRA